MRFYQILISFFLLACTTAFAQTGSWNPDGADLTFPRTLCKRNNLPAIRTSLLQPTNLTLYTGVFNFGNQALPAANTTTNERRARAKIAKDAAFAYLINLRPVGASLDSLTLTQKAQLKAKVKTILNNLNTTTETGYYYNEWQWRSKELIDCLIAYDLLRGAGLPVDSLLTARAKLQEFTGKLYTESTKSNSIIGVFFNTVKNNHALMTAAALGMAAVVLNDVSSTTPAQQPLNWAKTGLYHIDNVLWRDAQRQSTPGVMSGYAEGPYYFKYAFLNCLPYFRSMGHFLPDVLVVTAWGSTTRSVRNPWFDPNYDLLYSWITNITLPDGRIPALEDSYIYMGMPELAITGKSQYHIPMYFQNLGVSQLNTLAKQLNDVVDMRAAYLAANVPTGSLPAEPVLAMPASGNLVFRSGSDHLANYLHVYGKNGPALTNSGGHNQADVCSFSLEAYGQLLALDPGYIQYDRRTELGNAVNHNMILVDGNGPSIGSVGSANEAQGYVQNAKHFGSLAYGEVATAYQGASILRKVLSVRGKYFVMSDVITATAPHNYTWQLHGYGLEGGTTQGQFTDQLPQQRGIWQRNGVSLLASSTAIGSASLYSKQTSAHELTYNQTENHTVMLVRKDGQANTQFLSVLYPFVGTQPVLTSHSTSSTAAIANQEVSSTDFAFTQQGTFMVTVPAGTLPHILGSDAAFTFVSADVTGELAMAFLESATRLLYNSVDVLKSSVRATIGWEKTSLLTATVYADRALTLTVFPSQTVDNVTGANVGNWSYSTTTGLLTVVLTGPGEVAVSMLSPLPVTWVSINAHRTNKADVQLNWSTASEANNQEFIVERSETGRDAWLPVGAVVGNGTTSVDSRYAFTDSEAPQTRCYYRIRQMDFDGKSGYSPVVAVAAVKAPGPLISCYPVPASDELQIEFPGAKQLFTISLLNAMGSEILTRTFTSRATLDLRRYPAGVYFIEATNLRTGEQERQKISILH